MHTSNVLKLLQYGKLIGSQESRPP